jgi:hypothetical protein
MISRLKRFHGLFGRAQALHIAALLIIALSSACSGLNPRMPAEMDPSSQPQTTQITPSSPPIVADVLSVQASGKPGEYTFAVEVASPDEDCFQYADWWEVIDEDGKLLYRRVLEHSHADEQPFTRTGGPVTIEPSMTIWVRAHMNIGGYGGVVMKGSVQGGFQLAELSPDFAADLANHAPLPQDCAF